MRLRRRDSRLGLIRRYAGAGLLLLANLTTSFSLAACDELEVVAGNPAMQMDGTHHRAAHTPDDGTSSAPGGGSGEERTFSADDCGLGIGCVTVAVVSDASPRTVIEPLAAPFLAPASGPAAIAVAPDTPPPRA